MLVCGLESNISQPQVSATLFKKDITEVEVEAATTTQPPRFVGNVSAEVTVTYRSSSICSADRLEDLRHYGTREGNKY